MSILSKGLGLGAGAGLLATVASYFFDFGKGNPLEKFSKFLDPKTLNGIFSTLGYDENSPLAMLGSKGALPVAGILGSLFTRNIPGLKSISELIMIPSILFAGYNFLQGAVKGDFNDLAAQGYNLIHDNTLAENFKKTEITLSDEALQSLIKGGAGNDTLTDGASRRSNLEQEIDLPSISPKKLETARKIADGLNDQRLGEGAMASNNFVPAVIPGVETPEIDETLDHE